MVRFCPQCEYALSPSARRGECQPVIFVEKIMKEKRENIGGIIKKAENWQGK
jgi:hypothetical protein